MQSIERGRLCFMQESVEQPPLPLSLGSLQLCLVGQFLLYRRLMFLLIVPLPLTTVGVCHVCLNAYPGATWLVGHEAC